MRGPILATLTYYLIAALFAIGTARSAHAETPVFAPLPEGPPRAIIDLGTSAGAAAVSATWRYSDARIVEIPHRAPDAQGQPTGAAIRTHGIEPDAGWRDFDDSGWEAIGPETLAARRSTGRLCFNWYRIRVRIPERVGNVDTRGSTVVFETVLDDYAEVWVDGELARALGQRGGAVVGGWNAPNRIAIARNAQPGREIQLAVFGANGPLSDPPANFIWMRSAKLEFFPTPAAQREPAAIPISEVNVRIERRDAALDAIVPANPKLFKLAEGFQFLEGPAWVSDAKGDPSAGHLLFSDPNANRIYRYDTRDGGRVTVFRERSGYDGKDIAEYHQPGSNGLALDAQGRLTIAEHGRRRISRLASDGKLEVLADRFDGKRLNSPNDLIWSQSGTLYFSDPPFGLPKFYDDPRKELPFSGVFAWKDGALRLVGRDLIGPNGLALSPDERWLYVTNWDPARKIVMRYPVNADGGLGAAEVFFDMTSARGEEALDGIEVDRDGNLYVSGPGGIWILSRDAKHLGTIRGPQLPANLEWGDDGHSLYLTARTALYRLPLLRRGGR
jgi:gluconolactonase